MHYSISILIYVNQIITLTFLACWTRNSCGRTNHPAELWKNSNFGYTLVFIISGNDTADSTMSITNNATTNALTRAMMMVNGGNDKTTDATAVNGGDDNVDSRAMLMLTPRWSTTAQLWCQCHSHQWRWQQQLWHHGHQPRQSGSVRWGAMCCHNDSVPWAPVKKDNRQLIRWSSADQIKDEDLLPCVLLHCPAILSPGVGVSSHGIGGIFIPAK